MNLQSYSMNWCCFRCNATYLVNLHPKEILRSKRVCHNCQTNFAFVDSPHGLTEDYMEAYLLLFSQLDARDEKIRQTVMGSHLNINKTTIGDLNPHLTSLIIEEHLNLARQSLNELNIHKFDSKINRLLYISGIDSLEAQIPYGRLEAWINQNFVDVTTSNDGYKKVAAGAAMGAVVGSFIPVLGTAFGGIVGGALGAFSGNRARNGNFSELVQSYINSIRRYTFNLHNYFNDEIAAELITTLKELPRPIIKSSKLD